MAAAMARWMAPGEVGWADSGGIGGASAAVMARWMASAGAGWAGSGCVGGVSAVVARCSSAGYGLAV
ncbi:MAG: hypothetical protein M5U34_05025 [Chloroflexi bacterium]|nr:hypothetical protein [Chloroflexota bacterium]